ncbi:MAG: hypothetical protein E6772_15820 [Dysgonomonas sp.]|nr:hypothetical protein [Dysgonomonas sp.]
MVNKAIIWGLFLVLFGNVYAQVGINTEKPTSSLDVNGSVRITDNLLVGGDDNTLGSAGIAGQVLISKGGGATPEWQTVTGVPIPINGNWYLLNSLSRVDMKGGLRFIPSEYSGSTAYPQNYMIYRRDTYPQGTWSVDGGTSLKKLWKEFEDFTIDIPAFVDDIRVVINLQILVQGNWDSDNSNTDPAWISYAIAAFEDLGTTPESALLVATRQSGVVGSFVAGSTQPQDLATLVLTVDVPANKATKLRIMATERISSTAMKNKYLTFGQVLDNATIDDTILRRATMRADIYGKIK